MNKIYTKAGYTITEDRRFKDEEFGIDEKLSDRLEELYYRSQDSEDRTIIGQLERLIQEYPKAPSLKNYLVTAYERKGDRDRAYNLNERIVAEHPDYLYGRLIQASYFLNNEEYDKVADILGADMDIRKLFPKRTVFHLSEVCDFLKFSIMYFLTVDKVQEAEQRYRELEKVNRNYPDLKQLSLMITTAKMESMFEGKEEKDKHRKAKFPQKTAIVTDCNIAPVFTHEIVGELYRYNARIPHAILQDILVLPRESLISDLEKMLDDAVSRYGYFIEKDSEEGNECYFPLHAIFLLAELEAKESLPKVLSVLEYDDEFLDFWFGDHMTEYIWLYFYKAGLQNRGELIEKFFCNEGVNLFSKMSVADAMVQIALHEPNRRRDMMVIYEDIFKQNLSVQPENVEEAIDSDFLSCMVGNVADGRFVELLPLVNELYGRELVSTDFNGDYEDIVSLIEEDYDTKKEIKDIFSIYDTIVNTWYDDQDNSTSQDLKWLWEKENEEQDYDQPVTQPIRVVKVGRNDPCPCGSGKKYKKCCLPKE